MGYLIVKYVFLLRFKEMSKYENVFFIFFFLRYKNVSFVRVGICLFCFLRYFFYWEERLKGFKLSFFLKRYLVYSLFIFYVIFGFYISVLFLF